MCLLLSNTRLGIFKSGDNKCNESTHPFCTFYTHHSFFIVSFSNKICYIKCTEYDYHLKKYNIIQCSWVSVGMLCRHACSWLLLICKQKIQWIAKFMFPNRYHKNRCFQKVFLLYIDIENNLSQKQGVILIGSFCNGEFKNKLTNIIFRISRVVLFTTKLKNGYAWWSARFVVKIIIFVWFWLGEIIHFILWVLNNFALML